MAIRRHSVVGTVMLVLVSLAGLVTTVVGVGYAALANSPSNRKGNEWADIGVAVGIRVAIFGSVIMIVCAIVAVLRPGRRPDTTSRPK
jgi:hypothetical protein